MWFALASAASGSCTPEKINETRTPPPIVNETPPRGGLVGPEDRALGGVPALRPLGGFQRRRGVWAHDVLCTDCGKHLIMRTRALLAGACCERRRCDDADRKKASRVWVKVWNWAGSSGIRLHIEAALKLLNRKPSGRRRTR